MSLREQIEDILIAFGSEAYWFGEDTGFYSMSELRGHPGERTQFFTTAADQLEALLSGRPVVETEPEVRT